MCYLYLKLRVFLKRKVQPKNILKEVVSKSWDIYKFAPALIFDILKIFQLKARYICASHYYSFSPQIAHKPTYSQFSLMASKSIFAFIGLFLLTLCITSSLHRIRQTSGLFLSSFCHYFM